MKTLIVYAHPYEESYSHRVLERITTVLEKNKKDYQVIDLYKDEFQPTYMKNELACYYDGTVLDTKVLNYQACIKESDEIIFITPIWWNDVPGMLKGFFDKIFTRSFAYIDGERGVIGQLNHIKLATVVTSSNSPTWYIKLFCGNPIKKVLINATFKQVGIKKGRWINLGQIKNANQNKFLEKLELSIENKYEK